MNKEEIQEYIRENRPWSPRKEEILIERLGGGKIKGGHFYATMSYKDATDKIREAKRGLEDADYTYEEFIKDVDFYES